MSDVLEPNLAETDLTDLCRQALEAGQEIDLSGIIYGRHHWGGGKGVTTEPEPYYYFLAGLAKVTGASQCLEIGTHCGGGARSLLRGMGESSNGHVVTVDLTRESDAFIPADENITKIVGDSNRPKTVAQIAESFTSRNAVDIIFIDGSHQYLNAYLNFAIFSNFLNPSLIVFDDVALNEPMRSCWSDIKTGYPANDALDVTTLYPEIRKPEVGFGVVLNRGKASLSDGRVDYRPPHVWRTKIKIRNVISRLGLRL